MANTPSVGELDAPQIEIVFAGDLASDDRLWIVRCSVEELHRMVESPAAWVAALAKLPGWLSFGSGQSVPPPVLTRDFTMSVQAADVDDPEGWVTVQGISGTNVLSVTASRPSAARSAAAVPGLSGASGDDPFGPFWEQVSQDPADPSRKREFLVVVALAVSRWSGHMEILDPRESPSERAARRATFLLACALDPSGYAAMLGSLDQKTRYVGADGSERLGDPISITPSDARSSTYAAVGADPVEDAGPSIPEISCNFLDGPYHETSGGVGQPIVKWYGQDAASLPD